MSDEQFDKHIKQKLESVRPVFGESAWKKFRAATPVPWYQALFQDWGGWIFGGIASAAFLTTLYLNYLQQKTNELLNEEISTIKVVQVPQSKVDTVIIEKYLTDTVYIVKTVTKYQPFVIDDNQLTTINKQDELIESKQSVNNQFSTATYQVKVNRKQLIENNKITPESRDKPSTREARKSEDSDVVLAESTGTSSGTINEKIATESDNVVREKQILEKEKIETIDKPIVSDLVIHETKTEEPQKKKIKFPYVRTRVGLEGNYQGLKIPSVGPTAEFFFGYANLSFNTGLLFSSPQENRFAVSRDFNRFTGKQFEEFYKDKFRPQQPQRKIEDITIRTSLIKVPVAFNYYINARSNFDFMFTAGTRLDVSVFQDIRFENNILTERINERFEARPKPKVFSGLFYGMGLQYQKGRFVGQFIPYFDFRFRQNEYITVPRTFGVNASVKYDFGRGL